MNERIELTAADRIAVSALLDWSQGPLGVRGYRQVIVTQQEKTVTVTLRTERLRTVEVEAATLAIAAQDALRAAASKELS